MKVFINGQQLSKQHINSYISNPSTSCVSKSVNQEENILKLLHN